tara:strand:- start:10721 stop:11122 length:402 start_codon:yes stop_codon:yes gene_type:complete
MARGRKPTTGSSYKLKKRQKDNAKRLGVDIKVSTDRTKKIDVFEIQSAADKKNKKEPKKLASIGGMYQDGKPFGDYATYLQNPRMMITGKEIDPQQQRKMYLARHSLEPKEKTDKKGKKYKTPSYWADKILWD